MEITLEHLDERRSTLRLVGRLDLVSAAAMRGATAEAVDAGHVNVIADLSGVTFIDSSGLAALIGGLRHARQAGGELRIAAAGRQVLTVLKLTRLDRVLRPYDAVDDALEGL